MSKDINEKNGTPWPNYAAPSADAPATAPVRKSNGQFRKGLSGNPKGRPKKKERAWSNRQLATDILSEANRLVPVSVDGKIEYVSAHAVLFRQVIHKGMKGDTKAAKMALEEIRRAQTGRESKHWEFYKGLDNVENIASQPPIEVLETITPETLPIWRKYSRKV